MTPKSPKTTPSKTNGIEFLKRHILNIINILIMLREKTQFSTKSPIKIDPPIAYKHQFFHRKIETITTITEYIISSPRRRLLQTDFNNNT